ncbi:MAG: hypothetical protein JNK12_06245 [Acidimicrobiales bacterium]|nr:hypothetical protein [Acidimicrobiales bacterium]
MDGDGDGARRWWPPAQPWEVRRDELLRLRASRYSWRLPLLGALLVVYLVTTLVRGASRLDPVATVVPLLIGALVAVLVVKALDGRAHRREHTVRVLDAPALLALRGRHGLDRFDVAALPPWLAAVRALRERADGERLQVVAALRRGHELVVALVAGEEDHGVGPRDLLVVQRLPVEVDTFHATPRRPSATRVVTDVEDLYRLEPGPDELPAGVARWLLHERPDARLEATGEWLVVHPPGDGPPLEAGELASVLDELIEIARQLVAVLTR